MEEKFKQHLENKYGQEIRDLLYKEGKLITKNIIEDKDGTKGLQKMVQEHLKSDKISVTNLKFEKDNKWAFDFPGWTGKLDFEKDNLKKYMIVGLEPHIERYDFQITYGLSDNTPICGSKRFGIDQAEKRIICKNDSGIIWSNIFKLFASDEAKQKVFENNDLGELDKFLEQFFISDLCHFAPKDKAKAINNEKNWNKIRKEVAVKFLSEEIKLINPEIIICQGKQVFIELTSILEINVNESIIPIITDSGKRQFIRFLKWNEILIISIPHIGSKRMSTFWNENLNKVAEELNNLN